MIGPVTSDLRTGASECRWHGPATAPAEALATAPGFPYYAAQAIFWRGWALAMQVH